VVTIFNKQQCTEIMQPILQVGLPQIGCVQTMSHVVVHAPTSLTELKLVYGATGDTSHDVTLVWTATM